MRTKISIALDKIADNLEGKGLLKEAEDLDKISDAFDKIAAKKWIQKAKPKEGKFTDWCKGQGFEGVCQECIDKAAKQGGKPAKMALFAVNTNQDKYTYPEK